MRQGMTRRELRARNLEMFQAVKDNPSLAYRDLAGRFELSEAAVSAAMRTMGVRRHRRRHPPSTVAPITKPTPAAKVGTGSRSWLGIRQLLARSRTPGEAALIMRLYTGKD